MKENNITVLLDGYEITTPLTAIGQKRWRGIFIPEGVIPLDANIYPYQKTQLITQCDYGDKKGWYITFYHHSFELCRDGATPIVYIASKRDATQNKKDEKALREQDKWTQVLRE